MRKRDLEAEVTRFMEVYNEAWGHNWGFVPITEEEVRFQAKNLKPILDENWAMIAERDGEVVGAALTLPDINQVLAKMNGRLLPFGWWRFLTGSAARSTGCASSRSGSSPRYQHLGVAAALYVRHIEVAAAGAAEVGRDGLDPRDQRADEPRHGGHGRRGRPSATGSTSCRCRAPGAGASANSGTSTEPVDGGTRL